MIASKNLTIFLTAILLVCLMSSLSLAQTQSYLHNEIIIARFPMHFSDGFMFVAVPVIDTDVYGKAITLNRSFILDPAASNEGSYMPDDSMINITGAHKFYFPV